jgi:hypothetical protein
VIPEQVDFEDYREVDGMKLPFTIRITSLDDQLDAQVHRDKVERAGGRNKIQKAGSTGANCPKFVVP